MLNTEQADAVEAMLEFLEGDDNIFLLSGYAGTGKTYTLRDFLRRLRGRLVFTAPTNKATRVLRQTLTTKDYKPDCRTIYSLLGLRLEANGEVKELATPDEIIDLTQFRAIVVDEASMVNKNLMSFIKRMIEEQGLKFLFLGDEAQIPPVGETHSPVWDEAEKLAKLTRVMRHDNQILTLATSLRGKLDHPAPCFDAKALADSERGVSALNGSDFRSKIFDFVDTGAFVVPDKVKVIAWRNVTVDISNKLIRERIFPGVVEPWVVGDRIIMTEPAKDLEGDPMASTDDEGRIERVTADWHPIWGEFKVWRLSVTLDDNRTVHLIVLHEDSVLQHARKAEEMAAAARQERRKWKSFWEFKEAFHKVRYSYAITAHRSQGSTYESVFVIYKDLLLNRNRREAFQCLYVACTRASKELFLGPC